jgi:hypothetical protein
MASTSGKRAAPTGLARSGRGRAKPVAGPRRIALLIGNACIKGAKGAPDYRMPGIDKDLSSMGELLGDAEFAGFEIRTLFGPTLIEVRREIERLAVETGPDDVLLLYYTGTSLVGPDGQLYLPVSDSDQEFLQATCLESNFVLACLRRSECRHQFLLIDGCHAGALFTNNRGIPDGFCAITACAADQPCYGDKDGGFFTRLLVEGLRGAAADGDGDGIVTSGELFGYVLARARELSQPLPQYWSWNLPLPIPLVRVRQRLFLSYSRKDKALADKVTARLEAAGYGVWLDRESVAGATRWRDEIEQGLKQCDALVFLLSQASLASDEVKKELAAGIEMGKTILPLRLDQAPLLGWFKDRLGAIQQVDYGAEEDVWWKRLLAALRLARRTRLQKALSPHSKGDMR